MENNLKLLLIISVVIILISAGATLYYFKDKIFNKEETKQTYDTLRMKALHEGEYINAEYILEYNNTIVLHENLYHNVWDEYNAIINQTYKLTAWNPDFYSQWTECRIDPHNIETKQCTIELTNKIPIIQADINEISNTEYNLRIYANESQIRNPKVCIAWSYNIINTWLYQNEERLIVSDIPTSLKDLVDRCYTIDTIEEKVDYSLIYKSLPLESNDYIRVYILDTGDYFEGQLYQDYFNQKGEDIGAKNLKLTIDLLK